MVLAVALEAVVYLGLANPSGVPDLLLPAFRLYYQSSDRNIIQVTSCARYDSGLFYTLNPGSCQFANREFAITCEVNSAGLRDDETSLQNPEVVVLGDSYAMGWGVHQDEAFPQLLEIFSQHRVLNAGISSYGTAREVKLFNRLALQKVKTIFIQYHANDFDENQSFIRNHYALPIRSEDAYDSLRHHINSRSHYFPFKHLYGITKSVSRKLMYPTLPRITEAEAAATCMDILLHLDVNHEQVQIIIFKMDDHNRMNDQFAHAIDSIAGTKHFSSWKISGLSFDNMLTKDDYFVLDDHINAGGHSKIARKLAEALDQGLD